MSSVVLAEASEWQWRDSWVVVGLNCESNKGTLCLLVQEWTKDLESCQGRKKSGRSKELRIEGEVMRLKKDNLL